MYIRVLFTLQQRVIASLKINRPSVTQAPLEWWRFPVADHVINSCRARTTNVLITVMLEHVIRAHSRPKLCFDARVDKPP